MDMIFSKEGMDGVVPEAVLWGQAMRIQGMIRSRGDRLDVNGRLSAIDEMQERLRRQHEMDVRRRPMLAGAQRVQVTRLAEYWVRSDNI